jgi:hypothetical protein
METFAPQAAVAPAPDPTKHVNFTMGMVLGVDDFTQEFAYLSGRDQWLARDLVGYGTVSGLRVRVDDVSNPRVVVEAGTALTPGGRLVRVKPAQCAQLPDWVRQNQAAVRESLNLVSSPVSPLDGTLPLYVVLCYRDCPVDMVPIPGEPCRTEEDSIAPSRLKDDFRLELRTTAPYQIEEAALRDFVKWVHRSIEVTNTPGSYLGLEQFLDQIRNAVLIPGSPPDAPPASPPHLPPDFMKDAPAVFLRVHPSDACAYLSAVVRLWATELRPLWRPATLGEPPCCGGQEETDPTDEDCVLLARLDVPIVEDALTKELLIDGGAQVVVDQEARPILAHQRFLQEWMLCGARPETDGQVVAAGRFSAAGKSTPTPLFNFNLKATPFGKPGDNFFLLQFRGFNSKIFYVVKGTPVAAGNAAQALTFDVVPSTDATVKSFAPGVPVADGIVVRVSQADNKPAAGFMVEITKY